jgi:ABC-2 type transport system ATP-binding protein
MKAGNKPVFRVFETFSFGFRPDPKMHQAAVHIAPSADPGIQTGLTVRDLRVDYGAFTAVDGISFHIPPGTIFGLVGPNGAGKTSTIKVLATLLTPTYGDVSMLGVDAIHQPDRVHAWLGYMPDLAPVIGDLKVWEFVDHFAGAYGWDRRTRSVRVEECLRKVEMWESRNTFGKGLSRGMTQRVVLAKTLLPRPRILLLDEPASGMDPIARIQLKDILQSLSREGVIVLISSHILTELADMCTQVGIMHKGHMRYVGPVESVAESITGLAVRHILLEVLAGHAEKVESFLDSHAAVRESREITPGIYDIRFDGDDPAQAQLLQDLLASGIPVLNFTRKSTLEAALKALASES